MTEMVTQWGNMFEEIIAPLFTTEWGRRAGMAIAAVAACLLLYSGVSMLLVWHSDYVIAHSLSATTISRASDADNVSKWIAQIPERHVFGKFGVTQTAGLPVTSLQLRLIGVVKSYPEKYSRVIISEGNQPGKVYQVGDTLSSGVRVYGITDDGVVLDNGGTYEKLPLQRSGLSFQGKPKPLLEDKSPEE